METPRMVRSLCSNKADTDMKLRQCLDDVSRTASRPPDPRKGLSLRRLSHLDLGLVGARTLGVCFSFFFPSLYFF